MQQLTQHAQQAAALAVLVHLAGHELLSALFVQFDTHIMWADQLDHLEERTEAGWSTAGESKNRCGRS
jgi:hypothetical protein